MKDDGWPSDTEYPIYTSDLETTAISHVSNNEKTTAPETNSNSSCHVSNNEKTTVPETNSSSHVSSNNENTTASETNDKENKDPNSLMLSNVSMIFKM